MFAQAHLRVRCFNMSKIAFVLSTLQRYDEYQSDAYNDFEIVYFTAQSYI